MSKKGYKFTEEHKRKIKISHQKRHKILSLDSFKICSKCKKNKKLSNFYKRESGSLDGFHNCCIKCYNNRSKNSYNKNKEKRKIRQKIYLKENKEKRRILMQNYYKNNKEKINKKRKIWLSNNKGKTREMSRRRRNLKLHIIGSHTEQQWQDKKKEYNYCCGHCGIPENKLKDKYKYKQWWKLSEDHKIPLTRGGTDYIDNIIPSCVSCNSIKHNKIPKKYLITGGTGFVGQAIVKRLLKKIDVDEIRIYARDELKESNMQREIKDKRVTYWLGDIRNLERLKMACEGIDIIIHTAALKRMDVSSKNTFEVAEVNILGTKNVMLAGMNCEKIIIISTDKAVTCKNVYGASKFIAENVALAYPNSIVWRFGNIIGSRGSVWDIFKEQKEKNIPFTITDLNSTRFIISVNDVCDYILSDKNHGLYWPKNLKSMTIKQIADSIDPNYPYKIIGLRENETLHEKFTDEYSSDKCLIK